MPATLGNIYDARVAAGELRADPGQLAVLPLLEEIRLWLEAHPQLHKPGFISHFFHHEAPPPKGLYLWGGVGSGKSLLMDLFVGATNITAKRRVHFHAFMQEIQHGLEQARKQGSADASAPVAQSIIENTRLLAFDEMQINDIADAMIVGRLFEKLFSGGVIVVTTSNRPPQDLYKDGLNRQLFLPFIDMLSEKLTVHHLDSETDYRQHRLKGMQVYFYPAEGAGEQIDAIWRDLTGGTPPHPLQLIVSGHKLTLPCFASGVARATFSQLCDRPYGPADYLALAAACRVLIIEDIPILSESGYNQAKRFVTLIDALYEAKVRLICSAAAAPEKLYPAGEESFEFARAASRLREMQGADWGRLRQSI